MQESTTSIEKHEKVLADFFQRRYCVLTGNGTSALWTAYSLASQKRPKILLPAMVCLDPMLAVHYAGKVPVFADVLEQDATIDPNYVKNMLENDPEIGVVVAVHLYGHAADIESLRNICSGHDVLLIEDFAQAMGGRYADGSPFGASGDCSVVSFGHTKILDVGGGGAFLTDDESMAEKARTLNKQLGAPSPKKDDLLFIYRKLFYAIWECGKIDRSFYRVFDLFPSLFKSMHLYRIDKQQALNIINALKKLDSEVAHRKKIAALYAGELINAKNTRQFSPSCLFTPWRYTFRINKAVRNNVLNKVCKYGYDISSWYPNISEWTESGRMQGRDRFPVANALEEEVVNLWVTTDYTEGKAFSLIKGLKRDLSEA